MANEKSPDELREEAARLLGGDEEKPINAEIVPSLADLDTGDDDGVEPAAPEVDTVASLEALKSLGAQEAEPSPKEPTVAQLSTLVDEEPEKPAEPGEPEEPAEPKEPPERYTVEGPDDGIKRRWYVIHSHSGQESKVKEHLQTIAEQRNVGNQLGQVFVPMEEVAEIRFGEKKVSRRKYFPGYVLVQLPEHPERNPELWEVIQDTPGVTGFIGSRRVPIPLENDEVRAIIEEISGERERPKPKIQFVESERVKIIDGPFANFMGNISDINHDKGSMKVMLEIFERLTSVEVEFWQVEKI